MSIKDLEFMEDGFDYLAGPYSHINKHVMQQRFEQLTEVAAILKNEGHVIYSPITQGHAIHERHTMPTGWDEFWRRQSLNILSQASRLIVVTLDGWKTSVGTQDEIKHVITSMDIPIRYVDGV